MHVASQQMLVNSRHNKALKGLEMRQFANDTHLRCISCHEDLQMDEKPKR